MKSRTVQLLTPNPEAARPGSLDGRRILRFAHAFEAGGGVERILEDLDNTLLSRHSLTIVRMHLAAAGRPASARTLRIGRGVLHLHPISLPPGDRERMVEDAETATSSARTWMRAQVMANPVLWSLLFRPLAQGRPLPRRAGEMEGAGRLFTELHQRHRFDLCLLHFFGSRDADEVIQAARAGQVPIGLINHFANDRFLHLSIRRHVLAATSVAGVSGEEVPRHVADDFQNVGDGIDLSHFDPAKVALPAKLPPHPVLFLPARMIRTKGQLDLVKAARQLHDLGLRVSIVFAGREDSSAFLQEVRQTVQRLRLNEHVHFLGQLSADEIREWFKASLATVFPTYHPEGLPRVSLESQAMGTPFIGYATGGIAAGIREGETGFLVPTGDIRALVTAVARLLREPSLRTQMATAGRQWVQRYFTVEAMCRRHECLYARILSGSSSRN
jgi:glycosyltransferase involved in cell wall biosynthesis